MTNIESGPFGNNGVHLATRATRLLRTFNEAGVLIAADVHVANHLGRLAPTEDDLVLLGVAFAVRAPRLGHTCVDLTTIHKTADADVDTPVGLDDLPWPDAGVWAERLRSSPLVGDDRPLRLEGTSLYLDRYWSDECEVASELLSRAAEPAEGVDLEVLRDGMERLLGGGTESLQRLASVSAVLRRFSVVAGGPGTGKTTTVARILALVDEQERSSGSTLPLIALGAPTGKAAARLQQSVRDEASRLDTNDLIKQHLSAINGTTLHRLLGTEPHKSTRFRHHRLNPLPHDVVVVDETSMVPLSLMARLVGAVRADARLILVGDPEQLASVEAGAVLGDVVGASSFGLRIRTSARRVLEEVTGEPVDAEDPPTLGGGSEATPIGDGIVVLRRVHRFGAGIARLADSVRAGDASTALEILSGNEPDVAWIDGESSDRSQLEMVRQAAVEAGRRVFEAAKVSDAAEAISALGSFRLLCAHRRGPAGALTWAAQLERWMLAGIDGFAPDGPWYVGRPLLVTANDYALGLYNGDTGVVMAETGGRVVAAFEQGGGVLTVSPSRLEAVETVYAMTVHKSQGSQFDSVALVLPEPDSPILTRELLYTAVTRAKQRVIIVGSKDSVITAVERPIARSSGLRQRLWGA